MSLLEKIDQDLQASLKAGEKIKRQVLSMTKSALNNYRIEKRKDKLNDEDVITVLGKELKSRLATAEEFAKAGAQDRADQEKQEAKILEAYLPKQLAVEEIQKIVKETLEKLKITDQKQIGKAMGVLSRELKGKADLKKVNEIVRQELKA